MEVDAIMAGDDAAESWYVRARGRILGPLSWAQLQALRERGQLARFDQVSRDRQSWAAADTLERLFPPSASGGAFVAGTGPKTRGAPRDPRPNSESDGFLILEDVDEVRPASVAGADLGSDGPSADEPTAWYYAESGMPQGPVGYADLKRLARDRRIGPGTLYWRGGLEQWTSGADLPELNRLWPYAGDPGATAVGGAAAPREGNAAPGQAATPPRVDPLAKVSLALNVLCGAGNLAAIVVGAVALRRIARSGGTMGGKRLAIGGIATGAIGLLSLALAYFWFFAKNDQ
jgi:hypothetical protein